MSDLTRPERVAFIESMMDAGEWRTGKSAAALAKRWKLSENTVAKDAQMASMNIKRAVPDDEYRQRCLDDLEEIMELAKIDKDYRAAVAAIKLRLEARGLLRQKHQIEHVDPMTPHEIAVQVVSDPQLRPIVMQALDGKVSDGEFEET